MPQQIKAELDGVAQDSSGLQEVSDNQAAIMNHLADTFDGLTGHFHGDAAVAFQNLGEQLRAQGAKFTTEFADHSQKMGNNATILHEADQEGMGHINAVSSMIP
ncbi:WXG100 family type VII secretion target [Mycolicibacterium arenosum]|uniref:WXG100 family type VII secretion target n=1 Tax=Mycolicibacterium arenosum TaxID=2952157 RepID=A0ABT1MCK8_9MYCO|nr:WXG100 family type VII secretion target [Mycolicibacterium sp. CAU 1645]MCP9276911.1 WXG100 family type VII secretion target [Mycolicibacterium sp. CAU 1645]